MRIVPPQAPHANTSTANTRFISAAQSNRRQGLRPVSSTAGTGMMAARKLWLGANTPWFAWQRRRARAVGIDEPQCGAVTFLQRFGSLLNLNCHMHALLPEGVFATGPEGAVRFHLLPPPWDDDIVRLLDQIARAIHRLVERRLAQFGDDDPADLLASEQAAAIATAPFSGRSAAPKPGHRSAFLDGYSLHADRYIDEHDRAGLERLCRLCGCPHNRH
jgi:hypothetical protein